MELDDWQQWVLQESLSEASDQQWSAFEVAVIVGRQNGKGSILEARQLAGLFLVHERLQVHSAHEFKTCFEHFLRIVNLIESCPDLDSRVSKIRRGAGEQAIELKTGERLRFLARTTGSGRGMSGDAVYLDEAFALTPPMMGALLPTLSARPNPQVWYTSSAPMATSVVLHGILKRAKEADSPRLFLANWGHERGVDIEDKANWYIANPALGIRISEEFIESELEALRAIPDEFTRERLGVPDPLPEDDPRAVKLPADHWKLCQTGTKLDIKPGDVTFAVDADKDAKHVTIAVGAGTLQAPYVEVVEHFDGTTKVASRLAELVARWKPIAVGVNAAGPAGALVGPILHHFGEAHQDINLVQVGTNDYKAACGGFYTDVVEHRLKVWPSTVLDAAAADATERALGDAWAWDRRNSTVPISPLVAATIARALLPTSKAFAGTFTDLDDYLED